MAFAALGKFVDLVADVGLTAAIAGLWKKLPAAPTTPPSTASVPRAEDRSRQQMTSEGILPTRDDEAIMIFLDAALAQIDAAALDKIRDVRACLRPHQVTDWRKNVGKINLSGSAQRFDSVEVAYTSVRNEPIGGLQAGNQPPPRPPRRRGQQGQPQGVPEPAPGQQRIEQRFERQPVNDAGTQNDPRIQHLRYVASLVVRPAPPQPNAAQPAAAQPARARRESDEQRLQRIRVEVAPAIAYLISSGYIAEKSTEEAAKEAVAKAAKKVLRSVDDGITSTLLSTAAKRRIANLPREDRELGRGLALERKHAAYQRRIRQEKNAGLPRWFWLTIVGGGILILCLFADIMN